jgi:uncharacterized membrane protein YhhN
MTVHAWSLLLPIFGVLAAVDWAMVGLGRPRARRVTKMAAIAALVLLAAFLPARHELERWLFVGALVLGGVGDWFLLDYEHGLPPGLGAFLAGHVLYIAGFWSAGVDVRRFAVAAVVVALYAAVVGSVIIRALLRRGKRPLAAAVVAYFVAIGAMAASAAGSGALTATAGAALFVASDSLIGWNQFVRRLGWAELPIIVTYHLAQLLLVLSLL